MEAKICLKFSHTSAGSFSWRDGESSPQAEMSHTLTIGEVHRSINGAWAIAAVCTWLWLHLCNDQICIQYKRLTSALLYSK